MKKTSIRLADGRELIYFDENDHAIRADEDMRQLPDVALASEARYDWLADEWVLVASHRQTRTFLPPADECPLCPSTTTRLTEIPSHDYDVVVFENRFPSLAVDVGSIPTRVDDAAAMFERQPGLGRCEVVCFTSDHDSSFAELAPSRARTVVDVWADRTLELSDVAGVELVFPFENRGEEIGVTLSHPHGQIYAYPFVSPRMRSELENARRYRERTWRNLFGDLLAAETQAGVRVVAANEHWTAFVPAAARWPVEVQLYPHRQVADLPALTPDERDAFVEVYLDVLQRLDALYEAPLPYIAAWYQAPVRSDRDLAYLHLSVFSIRRATDKLKYLAGSESAMGVFINDATPESVAERLRQAMP